MAFGDWFGTSDDDPDALAWLMSHASDDVDFLDIQALLKKPAWHRDALCREPAYAHVNFFPGRGESVDPARQVCGSCLVRPECLEAGLTMTVDGRPTVGVWGGTSQRERIALGQLPLDDVIDRARVA